MTVANYRKQLPRIPQVGASMTANDLLSAIFGRYLTEDGPTLRTLTQHDDGTRTIKVRWWEIVTDGEIKDGALPTVEHESVVTVTTSPPVA